MPLEQGVGIVFPWRKQQIQRLYGLDQQRFGESSVKVILAIRTLQIRTFIHCARLTSLRRSEHYAELRLSVLVGSSCDDRLVETLCFSSDPIASGQLDNPSTPNAIRRSVP